MTPTLKAIETSYKGYRFRSRLEARWAVFFDTLGVEYRYEPEGFDLNGTWYLPDFWLPRQQCWVEIKGQKTSKDEAIKAADLQNASHNDVFIFDDGGSFDPETANSIRFPLGDAPGRYFAWAECSWCLIDGVNSPFIGIGPISKHYSEHCLNDHAPWGRYSCAPGQGTHTARIMRAYEAARAARFEHGEHP